MCALGHNVKQIFSLDYSLKGWKTLPYTSSKGDVVG